MYSWQLVPGDLDPYLTPTATPTGRVNLPMLTIGPALAQR